MVPDTVTAGALTWEGVDRAQGGLTNVHAWDADVEAGNFSLFHRDVASGAEGSGPRGLL